MSGFGDTLNARLYINPAIDPVSRSGGEGLNLRSSFKFSLALVFMTEIVTLRTFGQSALPRLIADYYYKMNVKNIRLILKNIILKLAKTKRQRFAPIASSGVRVLRVSILRPEDAL